MEIRKETLKNVAWLSLLFICLGSIFYSEALVSERTTILFGDEGYWGVLGKWTAQTMKLPTDPIYSGGTNVYTEKFTNTYLHALFTAGLFRLGGEPLVKASSPLLVLMTSLLVFVFVRRMYGIEAASFSTILFASLPSVVTHGVLLYSDMLLTLFVLASFVLLHRGLSGNSSKHLLLAGIFGGLAMLTKESGFLLMPLYALAILTFDKKLDAPFLKKCAVVAGAALLVALPWYGIHNYLQFGTLGSIPIVGSAVVEYTGTGLQSAAEFAGRTAGGGTEASVTGYGLLNYASFAYTIGVFFLAIGGFSYMAYSKRKQDYLWLLFTLLLFAIPLYLGNWRAEDAARFTLPAALGFGAAAGLFCSEIYKNLRTFGGTAGKIAAVSFVLVLTLTTALTGVAKADGLAGIKVFPQGFYDGCDWIRENTPQDAGFMTLWSSRAAYHCERDFYWSHLPDFNDIILGDADLTYTKLNEHGIDYIYIQKFSISFQPLVESYPLEFVRKLEDTDKYENVYENADVIVFKVK
ncbi:MAG: glycosyltransferase family 39 protein [Candidatus Aenigmatarchaeota archaeon]|nr:MAG: glycosyltransferase family 39 protein [Candidatus Aenigmarchaeota archaeon]